jgi:hypothetical protein
MSIPITDKFKPKGAGGYPLMDAEDILMPDGNRLSDFTFSAETPVFDLSAMGLPPLTQAALFSSMAADTTEIMAALSNGSVVFVIPVSIDDQTQNAVVTVSGSVLNGVYEHYFISGVFGDPIAIRLMINNMGIFVMGLHLPTVAGLPMIQEGDEGKFISVECGMFTLVSPTGAETPVFDLGALGLSAVPLTGGSSVVETDTTEIRAALDKGAVIFVIPVAAYGTTMSATLTMNGGKANGSYQCIAVTNMTEMATVTVNITDTMVQVVFASLEGSAPISIDLSSFESEGKIIETFPDSVKTTVMEFNSDGKPTKITDSNGNVTTLTW